MKLKKAAKHGAHSEHGEPAIKRIALSDAARKIGAFDPAFLP